MNIHKYDMGNCVESVDSHLPTSCHHYQRNLNRWSRAVDKVGCGLRLSEPQRIGPSRVPIPAGYLKPYRTRCGSESRGPPTLSIATRIERWSFAVAPYREIQPPFASSE